MIEVVVPIRQKGRPLKVKGIKSQLGAILNRITCLEFSRGKIFQSILTRGSKSLRALAISCCVRSETSCPVSFPPETPMRTMPSHPWLRKAHKLSQAPFNSEVDFLNSTQSDSPAATNRCKSIDTPEIRTSILNFFSACVITFFGGLR